MLKSQSLTCVARMMIYDFIAQTGSVDVCVDFGSGNLFVSQHALDGTQIGSSLKQMRGEGVTESVRTDGFPNSGKTDILPDYVENHNAAQRFACAVTYNKVVLVSVPYFYMASVCQVQSDFIDGSV